MEKDPQRETANALLEQAESFFTTTDFFKHGKLSFIKQLSAFLVPILDNYPELPQNDRDEIIYLFEEDLKNTLIKR